MLRDLPLECFDEYSNIPLSDPDPCARQTERPDPNPDSAWTDLMGHLSVAIVFEMSADICPSNLLVLVTQVVMDGRFVPIGPISQMTAYLLIVVLFNTNLLTAAVVLL